MLRRRTIFAIAWSIALGALAVACGLTVTGAGDPGVSGGDSSPNPNASSSSSSSGNEGGSTDSDTGLPITDGGGGDADTGMPTSIAFVQSAHASRVGSTLAATFPAPTKAGNFLAVLITYSNTADPVISISDNATGGTNTYLTAAVRSNSGTCQASEIWFARNVRAGATTITALMDGTSGSQNIWVIEASGLAPTGGLDKGMPGNGGDTTTITAPTVQATGTPAFFVAAVSSCGTIGTIPGGNPFTALPPEEGNSAAYHVATTNPGPIGPVYSNTDDSWNASVAAFR